MDSSSLRRTVVATICALGMLAWLWAKRFPGTAPDGDAAAPESSTESGLVASQASLQVAPASGRASRRGATAGGGRESELAPTHRVHVRLPDGSEAAGGEAQAWVLFWSNPPGMEYGVKMQGRARIGPGGIAEIALDDPAERVSALLLEVPGHPPHLHHVRGEGEPIEVQLPREDTVVLTGSIVDCTGHGLPGLPILLTSGTASEEIVFDTDLDIEARRLGPAGIHFVHVEATTDAAGRFSSRVPTSVADDWNSRLLKIQVLSRDASWFLSPAARFPMPAEGGEPTPIVATAVPGVCLDLRLSTSAPSRIFRPWLAIGTFAGSRSRVARRTRDPSIQVRGCGRVPERGAEEGPAAAARPRW